MKTIKCVCGALIRVREIPDFPGSKSGHVVYDHEPPPMCARGLKIVREITARQKGARVVKS
jgi:hypothetical protein